MNLTTKQLRKRQYYLANKEQAQLSRARRMLVIGDEVRAAGRAYYALNRDSILAYKKKYREENCEDMNERRRERYFDNKGFI